MGKFIDNFMWHTLAFSVVMTAWVSIVYGVQP